MKNAFMKYYRHNSDAQRKSRREDLSLSKLNNTHAIQWKRKPVPTSSSVRALWWFVQFLMRYYQPLTRQRSTTKLLRVHYLTLRHKLLIF